jgi:hypothetical protein
VGGGILIQITPQLRILGFQWWPTGTEPSKTLRAHQAQLLLAACNPETEAAPVWRRVSA